MNSLARITAIMKKEVLQLRRDRLTFGMIIGVPVMQMLLFGFAINTDVRNLATGVADQAGSAMSTEFIANLTQTQVVDIRYRVDSAAELEELLRTGRISIGVFVPADYERRLLDPERPAVHLLIDGVDPTIVGVANQLRNFPAGFRTDVARPSASTQIEIRPYYNPERRSAVFVIPGLIGIILTLTMMMFTAVSVVREREHGNLELLINTPVSNVQLMIGKVIPYILIGLIQLALILAVGGLLFHVPVRGSVFELYIAASVFIAANLALGLFVSTVVKTQFQAIQVAIMFLLPSILLSGFVFPFDGMPRFIRYIGELLPNTHFIRLTRGIMLRDAALFELYPELIALAVFTGLAMTAAIIRFSKRLD